MIDTIKYYWSVFIINVKLQIASQLEYASYMFCWLLMIPIQGFAGIYVLKTIMSRVDTLNGWNFGQVAFLFGLALLSHGFQDMLFIQTRSIEYSVLNGEFDRMLLRPMGAFYQFCISSFNLVGLFDMIPGIIIFLYGCKMVKFIWSPINILYIILITFGGTLIRAAVYTITGSIAFWTKKSSVFVDLNLAIFERTTQYPMSIYPNWFIRLFTFIIPIGFVSFYPVSGLLNISSKMNVPIPLDLIIWCPIVGIICFIIARAFFLLGLNSKYESAGS
ncbi:ABC transporter permease [Clostridium hydrogenum]|uniref:ABC transporter permease n=1 Tax=Clostridium hydrogenum TaxID=2855764 RepID=UPI001F272D46|nr:ABC-2 family transporter protein [Clostridium hydrogenum]